ncbi:MAG: esterase family protein [candidate division Zixibacteria bacterium]|nr:esterase family protein [candidate division Zixibacteria bacterium]
MKKIIFLLLILAAFIGCSKRDNPVESKPSELGILWTAHLDSIASLDSCIIPQVTGRDFYIYTPPVDLPAGETLPVLYLLHGYGGDYRYFNVLFDVKNLLDEMITSGEISPMFVILPDADNTFGGSFYVNSPVDSALMQSFSGRYEDYIVNDIMGFVNTHLRVNQTAAGQGISGHSMGGYGAYRIAMDYPDLFGSVSAMSAPVSFRGLLPLIPAVFAENGFTPGDTAGFYAIAPARGKRLTSMMFAMAAAFSPHSVIDPDTALFHRLVNTTGFVGVDLPFAIDGTVDTTAAPWTTKWLANDITTRFAMGGSAALQDKALYLDCGDSDDLGLHYQNRAFYQLLTDAGLNARYIEYTGYTGNPAGHVNFVNDRLREVLKFHDRAFNQ